jgi:signal transduction histidine kinase
MEVGRTERPGRERTQLEEFVALVAHEVRTPLAIAKSALQTVLDLDPELDDDGRRELLDAVDRNLDLAVLLLDRMNLAREIEADEFELKVEVVELGRLVRESVDDLRRVIFRDRPVEVSCAGDVHVEVDPTAVREIVFNLLSNAAKYSAAAAPIDVDVAPYEDGARVVVRDHGGGVDPSDTSRIFGKYYQADAGASGVGLGLFISRGLARAHGGDLTVRPAANDGSEFVIDLPRHA